MDPKVNTCEIDEVEAQPMETDNSTEYSSAGENSDQMSPQIAFITRQIPGD